MERRKDTGKTAVMDAKRLARDIRKRETPKTIELRQKKIRNEATSRLEKIRNWDLKDEDKSLAKLSIVQKVLSIYGFPTKEIKKIPIQESHKIALKLLSSDLLVSEFYNGDGYLSEFSERNYPNFNPEEYVVIPGSWDYSRNILEKRLKAVGWKENSNDDYMGLTSTMETETNIISEYANHFGKKSIIAIPFDIFINDFTVDITYQDNFVEPYGGDDYTPRLVFIPRD